MRALRDCCKALAIGLAAAAAVSLLLFLGGMLLGANGTASGLEAVKDGLLLLGALSLFLVAGMLTVRGKDPQRFSKKEGWRDHFPVIGPELVLGLISLAFLLLASAADYILLIR